MAKVDVYKYYNQCTKQMVDLQKSLNELQKSLGDNKLDNDKLEYLSNIVQLMRDNCDRLSYIVYLLNQPRFGIFKKRYDQANYTLLEKFKNLKVTKEDILLENKKVMEDVYTYMNKIREEINNGKQ